MRALQILLALAGPLLLADLVVETWLSGSPLRTAVAAGAAVGLGPLAVAWRDFGWGARAGVGVLVPLALLAGAVWLPDGIRHGPVALLHAGPLLVGGAAALGLAAAIGGLLHARFGGRRVASALFVALALATSAALAAAVGFGPRLEVTLAGSEGTAATFRDTDEAIALHVTSSLRQPAQVEVRWVAEEVEGAEPGKPVDTRVVVVEPGGEATAEMKRPPTGFLPGRYRAEVRVGDELRETRRFEVAPLYPDALPALEAGIPPGFDLARRRLGAKIASASSQLDEEGWAARNLIDGTTVWLVPADRGNGLLCVSCGWAAADASPQQVEITFRDGREAALSGVLLDTRVRGVEQASLPRYVEIEVAREAGGAFTQVAGARLPPVPGRYGLPLHDVRARRLRLRVLSTYGGAPVRLAELSAIEAPGGGPSLLAGLERDLASLRLGGALVRSGTWATRAEPYHVIDASDETAWRARDAELPRDLVFSFRGDREARLRAVELRPAPGGGWPTRVAVLATRDGPLDGWQAVGSFDLPATPSPTRLPLDLRARFVRLRILESAAPPAFTQVRWLEADTPGAPSPLFEPLPERAGVRTASGEPEGGPADAVAEREPNDAPQQANPLPWERFTGGRIEPPGEDDWFGVDVEGQGPAALTLELRGVPDIRTSLALLDPAGAVRARFDPGRSPGRRHAFSWWVEPGAHRLKVTEPPVSLVLVWDTSGSMEDSVDDLRRAVEASLRQVRSERLQLVRFNESVKVLLPDFSSDPAALIAAAEPEFFARGGTSLYDAIVQGLGLLEGVEGNRALVVMTDGADSGSSLDHEGLWRALERARVRLYTIGLGEALRATQQIGSSGRRLLRHLAEATHGRAYVARRGEDLDGIYGDVLDDLRARSRYFLRPELHRDRGQLAVTPTAERLRGLLPRFELILDASGSMREQRHRIDGRLKIEVAKEVMLGIVDELPEGAPVAFRTYGRRIREGRPGDCEDSELLFPFGPLDKGRFSGAIREIEALGTTPLAWSLEQAASDFGDSAGQKVVILVTDGKEECGGSPLDVVRSLRARGLDLRVEVVGFALAEEAVKREMKRVAELTGGRFYDAQDASSLHDAVRSSLAAPFRVLDAAGRSVASGRVGAGAAEVPAGIWQVVVDASEGDVEVSDVAVDAGRLTRVEIERHGSEVASRVHAPEQAALPLAAAPGAGPAPERASDPKAAPAASLPAAARPVAASTTAALPPPSAPPSDPARRTARRLGELLASDDCEGLVPFADRAMDRMIGAGGSPVVVQALEAARQYCRFRSSRPDWAQERRKEAMRLQARAEGAHE